MASKSLFAGFTSRDMTHDQDDDRTCRRAADEHRSCCNGGLCQAPPGFHQEHHGACRSEPQHVDDAEQQPDDERDGSRVLSVRVRRLRLSTLPKRDARLKPAHDEGEAYAGAWHTASMVCPSASSTKAP